MKETILKILTIIGTLSLTILGFIIGINLRRDTKKVDDTDLMNKIDAVNKEIDNIKPPKVTKDWHKNE